ncbi:TlpA disulfide reductase family protein [uncultured Pseudoteredinibacter sp.]|uniref:TlpA disulfide reductase family protein n=1 Tax=uncultured Pseudoteredinibacter sp. TaxID=1641701 RepID=UPI00260B9E24|nr:TlpA disulfide reductase family protein [uncultured Pseudoteredinibacter sp.]
MKTIAIAACIFSSFLFSAKSRSDSLDLAQYRGQVVYLDFWASWCVPCKKSFPWMNQIREKYKDRGLKIIAVSVDESAQAMKNFLAQHPAKFSVIHDKDKALSKGYTLIGMPTSFIYDREGKLTGSYPGYNLKTKAKIEAQLQALLNKG